MSFAGSGLLPDIVLVAVVGAVGEAVSVGMMVACAPCTKSVPPIRTDSLVEIPFKKLFLSTECPLVRIERLENVYIPI